MPVLGGVGIEHLVGEHEPWLLPLIRSLLGHRSGAFLDVGVNIGQTLIKVTSCDPEREYYGFEPNPSCYAYVSKLKEVNKLNHVRLMPIGLSDETQMGRLYHDNPLDSGATTVEGFRGPETYSNSQPVPLFRGDDILPAALDVAVVKIDVEGGELEVLRGLMITIRRCRPYVVCEILPIYEELTEVGRMRRRRMNDLLSLFSLWDYKIARLLHDGQIEPVDVINTHEELNLSDYLFYPAEETGKTLSLLVHNGSPS
ncbi:MAG: FkbM family methyltransferase [Acidobacteriota bacterium]|nr:FkbM family methyltransferase [Acidobacteriota bacterium]